MARNAALLLAIIVFAYAAVCLVLFAAQRSMIYFPQPSTGEGPGNALKILVPGAELRVSVRAHLGPKALIYFGGNAEDVSLSLPAFSSAFPDRALFLLHYRGYGGSTGKPSEEAIQSDALALFDRVHLEYSDIAVIGRSLGSGVATRLASRRPASSLVFARRGFAEVHPRRGSQHHLGQRPVFGGYQGRSGFGARWHPGSRGYRRKDRANPPLVQ